MRLPSFRSRNKVSDLSTSKEEIFDEAIELAQLRLQQCIADLQERLAGSGEELTPDELSSPEETRKVAAA